MKKMLQLIVPSLNRAGSEQIDVLYFIVKSNIWYFMVTCTVDSRNEILWRKWFNNRKNDVTHSCYLTQISLKHSNGFSHGKSLSNFSFQIC